jgi:outer membrane protein assembly factor BamB
MVMLVFLSACGTATSATHNSKTTHSPTTQDFPLILKWSKVFEYNVDGMAVENGTVIVGLIGINNQGSIFAYETRTGAEKWNVKIDGDGRGLKLKIHDGKVFLIYAPNFYALNLEDGSLVWKTTGLNLGDEVPAVSKKHLLVVKSSALNAYNTKTGDIEWSIHLGRGKEDVFYDEKKNLVYLFLGTQTKTINDENGDVVSEKDLRMPSELTFQDGVVYFMEEEPKITLNAFDISAQNLIWQADLNYPSEYLFIWKEKIIGVSNETITSMDRKSGDKNWSYMLPWGYYRPPVCIGSTMFLRNTEIEQVIALDLNQGNILGRLNLPARESMFMYVLDDDLLSIDSPNSLLALYANNELYVYGEQ